MQVASLGIWCVACLAFAALARTQSPPTTAPAEPRIEKVVIQGEEFKLELAADEASRAKGLMGRTELADHGGMIFIHPRPAVQSYWMANCLIDIDILFLDGQGKVVAAHEMKAEPPKRDQESQAAYEARLKPYSSRWPAQFAIELKAGTIRRLDLKPGMTIALDVERLKKLAKA